MLKKYSVLFTALLASAHLYANVPIESRALSQTIADNTNMSNTGSNLNWDLIQKNQKLEEEVRKLRGQLEEHDNSIEQLKKELANRYTDLDQRLELLSQKIDPPEENTEPENSTTTDTVKTETNSAPTSAPTSTAASPVKQDSVPQTPVVQPKSNTATTSNTNNQIELEKAAYTVALDAYKQGGAKQAIKPMQDFIKNYPDSIYIGNAHFWLAEFYLAIEPANYNNAKKNYEIVFKQFPQSAKAPRALYQLYSIAKNVDHNNVSANLYRQQLLKQFPKSTEAGYLKKP